MKDRVVIINGVSKAYAMTGWRIGFCAAPAYIAKAVSKLQSQYTSGCSSIAQKAAEAAYNGPQDCVEEMRQEFERRRDLICSAVQDIPGFRLDKKPSGAFYIFPDVSALFGKQTPDGKVIANADDVAMYLLETGHVAGVSGEAFGDPSCIRFSYATSQANISEAMRRVKEAVAKLRP
jgi:aspartate aminotransferase